MLNTQDVVPRRQRMYYRCVLFSFMCMYVYMCVLQNPCKFCINLVHRRQEVSGARWLSGPIKYTQFGFNWETVPQYKINWKDFSHQLWVCTYIYGIKITLHLFGFWVSELWVSHLCSKWFHQWTIYLNFNMFLKWKEGKEKWLIN